MSYMWNEFNIKTFPAETIVYRDGKYCPDLSTINSTTVDKNYCLPVHIIYVGEISGENKLDVEVIAEKQNVFLTVKIKNTTPAKLNIFIKNTGKNSVVKSNVILENFSELNYKCVGEHLSENTTIIVKNRLIAYKNSKTILHGDANIKSNCPDCVSDIGFAAINENNAFIEFMPTQRISSIPKSADHSAAIYKPTDSQILYLRESGLGTLEITDVIKEAFINDFDLY